MKRLYQGERASEARRLSSKDSKLLLALHHDFKLKLQKAHRATRDVSDLLNYIYPVSLVLDVTLHFGSYLSVTLLQATSLNYTILLFAPSMPNLDQNNVQSVEFEAPLSADASSAPLGKHFSIDLSLELERQLDMESYPPTPSHATEIHTQQDNNCITRDSLDPQILAHIIKQLRQSLVEVTKDRDELLEMVALSTTHETDLQEALQQMTDKATKMEVELSDARKKMQDDEDSINMLRTKVEESR